MSSMKVTVCCQFNARACSEKRGNRKDKPIPRIVFRYGEQYRKVKWFLETRKFLLDSLKRLKKEVKRKKKRS